MPNTPRAAPVSDESQIHAALRRAGLAPDAVRIVHHTNRDCTTFAYPGYRSVDVTGFDRLAAQSTEALLDHKVAEMLRMPLI
jgi:hypothetical protein